MDYKKLSDCADFRNERTKQIDFETYISTENILPNKAGVTIAESLPNAKTTTKYLPKDILLSNIRPYFKKIWLSNREGGCSNDVLVVTAKPGINPSYLYYVLSDNNFFNYDTVTAKGTKMPRGTPKAIMKYLVPDVDKEYQDKIVFILSKYDSLIEINNKRIKVLEQMAENLYKEWFVRFRFPGHENAEFENGIPKGWAIKKLSEISSFAYGKMPDSAKYVEDGYPIFSGYRITGYYDCYMYDEPMLVLIARGVGGTGEVKVSPPFAYITNLAIVFLLFKPKLHLNYLYRLFSIQNLRYLDTGAAQSQITIENLKNVRVIIPPEEHLIEYNTKAEMIKRQIDAITKTNDNLIKQRDLLLPRLMSGKLEV